MVSASTLLRFAGLLVELRDSVDYLPAAASELQRLIECDDIVWMDADFPADRFLVWRASAGARDRQAERAGPHLLRHPAVESYIRDPKNLAPRRESDVADLAEPAHLEALHISREVVGHYQLSMVTHVDPVGLGRGWIVTRGGRAFGNNHVEVASRLLPVLLALDRVHLARIGAANASTPVESPGWADLSVREHEVVDLLATGLTAPAIGRMLGISPRTVGKHLENVYRKLGQHDRLLVARSSLEVQRSPRPNPSDRVDDRFVPAGLNGPAAR